MVTRKIDLMYAHFGKCEGHICKECDHFCKGTYHDISLRKCEVYGLTHSEATDWSGKYPACSKFNQPYHGMPIVRFVTTKREELPPIEGQMTFEQEEDI